MCKCGAALTPDKPFCAACGAPVAAAPPAFTPVPNPAAQVQAIRQCSLLRRPRLRRIRRCCHRQCPKAQGSLQCQRQQCLGILLCSHRHRLRAQGLRRCRRNPGSAGFPADSASRSSGGPAYTPVQTAAPAARHRLLRQFHNRGRCISAPGQRGQSKSGSTAIKIVLLISRSSLASAFSSPASSDSWYGGFRGPSI